MTTTVGFEVFNPMRHQKETGPMHYPCRPSGGITITSTGSSLVDDYSRHSTEPFYQPYQNLTMEDSGNIKNRAFTTSNTASSISSSLGTYQPTSRHMHRAATVVSERDASLLTNTGAAVNVFTRNHSSHNGSSSSSLNKNYEPQRLNRELSKHSDHSHAHQTQQAIPAIQRSQSQDVNASTNSDSGVDSVIEEKRKLPNGDGYTIHRYTRGKLLGKGGFAKVYLCTAMDSGKNYAVKVVPKANLVKARARQKLQVEIKIHRHLKHEHICQYKHYFEDRNNCYILLELCHNQSLNEMIKRRKRLTEPEAAYFIAQLIKATRYMHNENVIHRDLKLGNLFLDIDMNIKVGDLGLATRLEDKDEKRKTICGTPNYIAPEIIQGDKTKRGHSFEVDIWSIGVILYTILIGKPPYEAKDVKATYQRILNNEYSFPRHIEVSERAKSLIRSMLQSDPADRPSLDQIEEHSFLSEMDRPLFLPSFVMTTQPIWRYNEVGELVCTEENQSHYPTKKQLLPPQASARQPFASRDPNLSKAATSSASAASHLKSAPSAQVPVINVERIGQNALAAMAASKTKAIGSMLPSSSATPSLPPPAFKIFDETAGSVKLRTMPSISQPRREFPCLTASVLEAKNSHQSIPNADYVPPPLSSITEIQSNATSSTKSIIPGSFNDELLCVRTRAMTINGSSPTTSTKSVAESAFASNISSNIFSDVDILKKMADHLDAVIEITESRKGTYGSVPPRQISPRRGPTKWVTRYVDYTSKYGLGFLLNDGCSGVYFNDSTKAALQAEGDTFQYIERKKIDGDESSPRRGETTLETHSLEEYPESLKKKVTLLKHFRNYLMEQQMKSDLEEDKQFYSPFDIFGMSELVYVKKWVRTKHAIMFFLSNRTVQVVFYDQTEILFTPDILTLTYVDKNRLRSSYDFTDELVGTVPEIEKRLKYTKEIMIQLLSGHRP